MNESNEPPAEADPASIELAKMIGARHAMGLIAGRCSAADAEMLRRIRDGKKYLSLSATWDEFCRVHLHISKRHADRTIQLLNEFGPGYFELSQLTRISPREFRAIAGHVHDQSLHVNGEAIALIEANSEQVVAAVNELREKSAAQPSPEAGSTRLADLERRCQRLVNEFYRLRQKGVPAGDLEPFARRAMMMFDSLHLSLLGLGTRR